MDLDLVNLNQNMAIMVCGWGKIHGYPIGIVANNGVIFSESANKGAQFIQLSNKNDIHYFSSKTPPDIWLGKLMKGGIIKNGAKLINAVSNSKVPSITLMIGSSFGAGNYGMNGKSYDPRFLFTYPNAKIGVMGSEQLAGVMDIIQRASAKALGITFDEDNAKVIQKANAVNEAEDLKKHLLGIPLRIVG